MITPYEGDGPGLALSHLTRSLGLYYALYGDGGQRSAAAPPGMPLPCPGVERCPLTSFGAACPGAAVMTLQTPRPLALVACHADPSRMPVRSTVRALSFAFRHHVATEDDAQATVRELSTTYQELAIAYGVMETISLPGSREAIAEALLAHLACAAPAEGYCILAADEAGGCRPLAVQGMAPEQTASVWETLARPPRTDSGVAGTFTVPVGEQLALVSAVQGEAHGWGMIGVMRPADRPFTSRDAKLLQAVGQQAGLAMRNRALVDDLRSMFMSTLHALVAAIEVKDAYTCGHSRRVAQAARETASLLGLPEPEAESAYMAGIVHDIGKIAVEKAVLCKPGKLSSSEWETVRVHPDHGAGIINCIPQLQHLVPGIRHHHERCDGRGYPLGLRDEQIPLQSRIIAVCDTFDAMTSERSYRPALSRETAIRELEDCSGTQFSRDVVEALVEADSSSAADEERDSTTA